MADSKVFKFDICEEAENTFVDDDTTDVSTELRYEENHWPKEDPSGFSFKGKNKQFQRIVENLKVLLKKGSEKIIGDVSFKILDAKKIPSGTEYEVEVQKNKSKGVAITKIFCPNQRKICTVTVNKSKKFENEFVKMLAVDVIKQLIDRFQPGDGWIDVLSVVTKTSKKEDDKKSFYCHFCGNGFCNIKNLKVHIDKFHRIDV